MGAEMAPICGAFSGDISLIFSVQFRDHILNQFCGCFGSAWGGDLDNLLRVSKLMGRLLARRRNMQNLLNTMSFFNTFGRLRGVECISRRIFFLLLCFSSLDQGSLCGSPFF